MSANSTCRLISILSIIGEEKFERKYENLWKTHILCGVAFEAETFSTRIEQI